MYVKVPLPEANEDDDMVDSSDSARNSNTHSPQDINIHCMDV